METKGAVLWGVGEEWSVEPITIRDPIAHEVTVKVAACGVCHTDEHLVTGDLPVPHWPIIGGHEAAGEIVAVGGGVEGFSVGDRVVLSAMPGCGRCRPCLQGYGAMCVEAWRTVSGESIADDTRPIRARGREVAQFCGLGAFAEHVTVHEYSLVKIVGDLPWDVAALLGCGVSTGWGAVVNVARVGAGDTAVVFGLGGVGAAAVLACVAAGAERVVVVDPAEHKRSRASDLGATHFFTDVASASEALHEETWGQMADKVIVTVGRLESTTVRDAMSLTGKLGVVAAVSGGDYTSEDTRLNVNQLRGYMRSIRGVIQNGGSPKLEIARLMRLYQNGRLPLDRLITARYPFGDINRAYQDLRDAKNIRGVLAFD